MNDDEELLYWVVPNEESATYRATHGTYTEDLVLHKDWFLTPASSGYKTRRAAVRLAKRLNELVRS
jgi:hypothetical protein